MSGLLYVWSIAYLAGPTLGFSLGSATLAAGAAALPLAVKVFLKSALAFPFTLHSFNGVRHLVWDLGRGFGNMQVIKSGWTVVALSVLSSLYLAFI